MESATPTITTLPVPPPSDPSYVYPLEAFAAVQELLQECRDYPALSVPAQMTARLRKQLKHVLLHLPKRKTIFTDDLDPTRRILLLQPGTTSNIATAVVADDDPVYQDPAVAAVLLKKDDTQDDCRTLWHTVRSTYEDLTVDEVLHKILPVSEIPAAFEMVGTLVHLNLRPDVLPYKLWVGKVLLDKLQPRIQTVVNKLGNIETEFRTFGMEILAGGDRTNDDGDDEQGNNSNWSHVTVKEEGCTFELDFRHVYWNSRLAGEHRRLVELICSDAIRPSEPTTTTTVVVDLMAGVGPFAIPLTATAGATRRKKHTGNRIQVYANDLNPSSYKYLKMNAQTNKCEHLHCFNMDARKFVRLLQTEGFIVENGGSRTNSLNVGHVIMNLPASAPEFLDAFQGWSLPQLPRLHVHCFCPKPTIIPTAGGEGSTTAVSTSHYQEAVDRCSIALGCPLDLKRDGIDIRVVRDVSPVKNMLCVSFILPEAVRQLPAIEIGATPTTGSDSAAEKGEAKEPDAKKARGNNDEL